MTNSNITEDQKKIIHMFVLINLIITGIEDPVKVPTKQIKKVYDILNQAVEPLDEIIDGVYANSKALRSTPFLQELEKKCSYNIIRESKKYAVKMK